MNAFTNILFAALVVIWALLVRHWWKRRKFFPILGHGRATKVWWGCVFLLFNPLLMLLYLAYGVFHRPKEAGPVSSRYLVFSRVLVIGLTLLVVALFKIPWGGGAGDEAHVARRGEPDGDTAVKVKATTYESSHNTSSLGTKSNPAHGRFQARRIHISTESDHPLMDKVARKVQRTLADLPYVDEVVYYPVGAALETCALLPDVFVTLRMPSFDRDHLPMRRAVKAKVICAVSSSGPRSRVMRSRPVEPPLIDHGLTISIEHRSTVVGVESSAAVYDQEADSISKAITDKTVADFKDMVEEHGFLPDLPEIFFGPYEPAPAMPFDNLEVSTKVMDGYGLVLKNLTAWTYRDDRPTPQALAAIRDELARDGWKGGKDIEEQKGPLDMLLKRGDEHLTIFRRDAPRSSAPTFSLGSMEIIKDEPKPSPPSEPMVAKYEKRFSFEEFESVVARLVDENPDPDVILMFAQKVRSKSLKQRMRERLSETAPRTVSGCLQLAALWIEEKETDKAWALLEVARALARGRSGHGYKSSEIKNLAKKLGDENRIKKPIPVQALQNAGLVAMDDLTNAVTGTVKLGESFGFYTITEVGDIKTFAYSVVDHVDFNPKRRAARKPDSRNKWRLLKVRKDRGSSSVGQDPGRFAGGKWETSVYLRSGKTNLSVQVRETGHEQFEWSATPSE